MKRNLAVVLPLTWIGVPSLAQPCTAQWTVLPGGAPDGGVEAIAFHSDAAGPVIFIGGKFETVGGLPVGRVARHHAGQWSGMGSGIPFPFNSHGFNGCCAGVMALAPGGEGGLPLLVGGDFIEAGGVVVESIGKWTGAAWESLAGGLAFNPSCMDCPPRVHALVAGAPGVTYAIGSFELAGGAPVNHVAAWNGAAFVPLAGGLSRPPQELQPVWGTAGITFDDGSGESLFVGGFFSRAGNTTAHNLARFDGQAWHAVGAGITQPVGGPAPTVNALAVHDDGTGPALFIAGYFQLAGGVPARHIAKWNGQAYEALGAGLGSDPNDQVHALAVFDDGGGMALYAGGRFDTAGGVAARNIASWRGGAWSSVGGGVQGGEVRAMTVVSDGVTPSLAVGGWFTSAGGGSRRYLALWTGCPACPANCDGSSVPPVLNIDDFTCFINEFASAQALPHAQQIVHYANCDLSTVAPVLNVDDFTCFINLFAAGCR